MTETKPVILADGVTAVVGQKVKVVANHFGFDGHAGDTYTIIKFVGKSLKLRQYGGDTIPANKCVSAN